MAGQPNLTPPETCGARIGQPLLRKLFPHDVADETAPCEDAPGRCRGVHRSTLGTGTLTWAYTVSGAIMWGSGDPDEVAESLRSTVEAARDFEALQRAEARRSA